MLKAELLGQVDRGAIQLTQDKREFSFEFCNFAARISVYYLVFCFESEQSQNTQKKTSEKHISSKFILLLTFNPGLA